MSSDLAVQHRSTPPSPASSTTNSLDDRVNSPTARVYFGPIQSPEKILIAEAAHSWNNPSSLPVRLSPRISSPRDSHPSEEDESAVRAILEVGTTDVPSLATTTLDEDCLQDDIEPEPTSALATKISWAHDNPSPPPQMQPPKQGNDDPTLLTPTGNHHISPPAGSTSAAADGLSRRVSAHSPSPTFHTSGGSLDRMQTTSPLANDSADLIIFDDNNIPNIPLASPVVKPLPDLLAPTPLRCPAPFVGSADATSTTPLFPPRIGSGSPRDEGLGEDHLSPSKVATRPRAFNQPLIESPTQLCRSVHPSSPRPISPSSVDPSTTCLLQVDTTPSAMAKPPPPSSHSRELRSLSPASEGVLYNLLSVTEDVTTTPLHQIPVLVPASPLILPPHDWASTPGRQSSPERPSSSVNTSEVQRPAPDRSPWRNHIARAESPNKLALNNTLSDPNRTPTQRIPIAQRPASPRKDSTPNQSSGIFGRPVFTRYTQEERTRSPVRPLPSDAVDRAAVAGMSGSVVPEKLRIVDARLPDTIPEEPGPFSPTKSAQPSPARKSALRQPSSTVGSRIPRIGAKPYARPIEKEKQQGKGNEPPHKPAFVTRRLTPSNSALSLKRKRSPEEAPSPTATQHTVARRVTPIPKAKQKSSPVPPGPSSESGVPAKKARIGNVRKAGGDTISQIHHIPPPLPQNLNPSLIPDTLLSPDVQTGPATPPTITTSPEPNENFSNSADEDPLSSITYVTRSRRASQPTSDVFGAVRSLQQHRRRTTQGGTFSSMSAVTLKALTNTNTARNQHNLAAILETEVVRKPGNRPGSPGTKVRTIDEKRKLEQGKERRERAERRARRVSEPQEDSSLTSEDEANLPLGSDGRPVRHRRGPGDEEEYESPKRPRTRARSGEAGKPEEEAEAKTVRWDRGLFTTIYFDDLPLQSQTHDRSHTPVAHNRGALASSAKVEVQAYACENIRTNVNVQALRLDSLGNLVNATSPLKDIVRENVTIKKFVYDDDAEAAEHEVPKPPSKGKGKKLKG
ncbi:hypothetical protein EDB83DRAFT_2624963 [Lactarius deliciosus]|nr:hypothetical protein EDB83DRAFT_2624963 [Lactarius deliciosus]